MVKVFNAKKAKPIIEFIVIISIFLISKNSIGRMFLFNKNIIELSYRYYKELIAFQIPIMAQDEDFKKLLDFKNIIKFSFPVFANHYEKQVYEDAYYYEDDAIIIPYDENQDQQMTQKKENVDKNIEFDNLINSNTTNNSKNYKIELMNQTDYKIDIDKLLNEKINLPKGKPSILIYHTHTTESYNPSVNFLYKTIDSTNRTIDYNYNVVRVGEELKKILEKKYKYKVYHSKEINDYPEYRGSYTRSLKVIEEYKKKYPDIKVFIDLHRDAIGEGDKKIKVSTLALGEEVAKVMLVVGTDKLSLYHPNWRQNLAFALKIQKNMMDLCPSITRPINISVARYNQHVSPFAILIEVGSNGNTLDEALRSCPFIAEALNRSLLER